jgi:hypothetical protein
LPERAQFYQHWIDRDRVGWDSQTEAAPGLRALHDSGGIATGAHCFQIVFSTELRSAAMHWRARRFSALPRSKRFLGRARLAGLHFGRTISIFVNENNNARNHLRGRPGRLRAGAALRPNAANPGNRALTTFGAC